VAISYVGYYNCVNNNYSGNALMVRSSSTTVTNSTVSNSAIGIRVEGNALPTITGNSFTGNNSYGVYNSSSTVTVIAENNWWGDPSGPAPYGSGDAVNATVDPDPWLTEAP
jgi:parallel beta-helix repeat protein